MEASTSDRTATTLRSDSTRPRSLPDRIWLALSAAWAAITGLLPHVLHHAGPLAGAALFAGAAGSLLFGAIGLLAAIPFLRRLHRRFGTWQAPALALAVFALVFSVSTFVIGPKISGESENADGTKSSRDSPAGQAQPANGHEAHHD